MEIRTLLPLAVLLVATGCSVAQQPAGFEVALRDGSVLAATTLSLPQPDRLLVQGPAGRREVPLGDLLAIHGAPVQRNSLPGAFLAGGERVRGALVGGDSSGNLLELQSPVLGRVRVPVDRLELLLLRDDLARPTDLRLPDGVEEALFTKAAVGFDLIAGSLHQFGDQGLRFQPASEPAPRWFRTQDLVALRVAGAVPLSSAAAVELLTRTGDRLRVQLREWRDSELVIGLDDGATQGTASRLRSSDLACLLFPQGVVFASDLEPKEVVEQGYDADVLLPWQRNQNVLGDALVAAGRAHARGIGAHSRSRLVFAAPPDAAAFWTRVAIDDSAQGLPFRADASVRVTVAGRVVFEHQGLAPGNPPLSTGLLPVKPGDPVALEVDFGKGRNLGDRVDWLSPVFLPARR